MSLNWSGYVCIHVHNREFMLDWLSEVIIGSNTKRFDNIKLILDPVTVVLVQQFRTKCSFVSFTFHQLPLPIITQWWSQIQIIKQTAKVSPLRRAQPNDTVHDETQICITITKTEDLPKSGRFLEGQSLNYHQIQRVSSQSADRWRWRYNKIDVRDQLSRLWFWTDHPITMIVVWKRTNVYRKR